MSDFFYNKKGFSKLHYFSVAFIASSLRVTDGEVKYYLKQYTVAHLKMVHSKIILKSHQKIYYLQCIFPKLKCVPQ